ncbi:hypothetical protein D3C78_1749230 [compost metagenome]
MFFSEDFNRARHQFFATTSRAVRLGKHTNNLVAGREQRIEMTRCEVRCSRENYA